MPKTTVASLEAQFLAFKATTEGEIAELKSRLTALGNTRSTRQNKNVGRPITANQAKAIGEFGVDTTDWDFMQASRFLDEMSAYIKALGIRHFGCGTKEHKHTDRDEARKCAMQPKAKQVTGVPEVDDLDLPSY